MLLLLGRGVSNLGTQAYRVALTVFVLSLYGSKVYGMVTTISAIPQVIFVVIGGVICDRYSRSRIMAIADFFGAIAFGGLALLVALERVNVPVLYSAAFFLASASAMFEPASATIVPLLVPKNEIGRATAVVGASDSAIATGGPGIGGTLTSLFGAPIVFLINAVSFLFSGVSELFITTSGERSRPSSQAATKDIIDGFKYFTTDRALGGVVLIFGFLNFVGSPLFLFPAIFAAEKFGQSAFGIALTFVATSLGGAIFSLILYLRRDFRRKSALIFGATLLSGVIGITLPFVERYPLFLLCLLLMGATFGVNINILNIILRTRVENEFLGRAYSFYLLLVSVLIPFGYALSTWLLGAIGLEDTTIAGGVAVATGAPFLLMRRFRSL